MTVTGGAMFRRILCGELHSRIVTIASLTIGRGRAGISMLLAQISIQMMARVTVEVIVYCQSLMMMRLLMLVARLSRSRVTLET